VEGGPHLPAQSGCFEICGVRGKTSGKLDSESFSGMISNQGLSVTLESFLVTNLKDIFEMN
jgi:hypothetical protein